MTTPAPANPAVAGIRLAAVLTAVGLTRQFIRQTLTAWQLTAHIDNAELIASELATNAVKETGLTHPSPKPEDIKAHHVIGVQLRAVNTSLYIEVWDRATGSPAIPEQTLDAEGGRGLFLVEALSQRWDTFRPGVGGKIVWAELPLTEPVNPLLLGDRLPRREPGSHRPIVAGAALEPVDLALLQRVLDGPRQLTDLSVTG
jgi:anti-sigma regulatory factor (Ser/Thr protein kinase)